MARLHTEPNVTPMIDVMLVLLIIFLVITPTILSGFPAVPPAAANLRAHPEEPADVMVGIDANGRYYLNKRPIEYPALASALREIYRGRQDRVLYIKAHRDLEYRLVLDALEAAGVGGVRAVGMIAEKQAINVSARKR